MKPFKLNLMRGGLYNIYISRLNKIGIKLIVDLKIYLFTRVCFIYFVTLLIELDSFENTQLYSLKYLVIDQ